jgi:cell division protein FtsW (lipid II flippase)
MDSEVMTFVKKLPWNYILLTINLVVLYLVLVVLSKINNTVSSIYKFILTYIDERLVGIDNSIEDTKSELIDLNESIRRIDDNLDAFEKLHKPKEIIQLSKEKNL